jgi:hypothetical protein
MKPPLLLEGLGIGLFGLLLRSQLLLPLHMQVDLALRDLRVRCEMRLDLLVAQLPRRLVSRSQQRKGWLVRPARRR